MVHVAVDIAKNTLLAFRPVQGLYAKRRLRAGREVMKRDASYPASVFEVHRSAIERFRPISGTVLEIGPGGDLAVAALFVRHGATEAVCIDRDPWLSEDWDVYQALGLDDSILARVRYECPCPIETAWFEDGSFDIIYSHACFEHIAEPGKAIESVARLLGPGGITTHLIDLRDHRDFDDPLRFLRHRDLTWKLAMSRRLAAQNRWRLSSYTRAFTDAGLQIAHITRTATASVSEAERRSFAPRFRHLSIEELSTTGVLLTATKS